MTALVLVDLCRTDSGSVARASRGSIRLRRPVRDADPAELRARQRHLAYQQGTTGAGDLARGYGHAVGSLVSRPMAWSPSASDFFNSLQRRRRRTPSTALSSASMS